MGNFTLKENVKKNKEYFENLQKCYNPTEVVSRAGPVLGRSRSSEALWDSTEFSQEQKLTEFLRESNFPLRIDLLRTFVSFSPRF